MKQRRVDDEALYSANDNEPVRFEFPPWVKRAYFSGLYRYVVNYGGRGSMKSYIAAACAVIRASREKKLLIVCGREVLKSLQESVHSLIVDRIDAFGLTKDFRVTRNEITCIHTGSRFIFIGLERNIESIKSMTNIDILWIEEAASLSTASWDVIVPTVRKPGSQIWLTFNPTREDDIVYKEFVVGTPDDDAFVLESNYRDNPYLSDLFLKRMEKVKRTDYGKYLHVYEGQLLVNSEAQIFHGKWVVEEFEEDMRAIKYYGLDFGTSDPTAAIRSYIKDNKLYITHEAGGTNIDLDDLGKYLESKIPDFRRSKIMADNSRPETIGLLNRRGYRVEGAEKGKGSIEDGIAFMRSFEKIVINPRCINTIKEFMLYSYKVDRHTEEITRKIVDKHNHYIDAIRYALRKLMTKRLADYKSLTKF